MNKIVFVALSLLSIFLSSCASSSISSEKQKGYGLLVPAEKGGSPDIVMIDQETFHRTLLGSSRDVLPGRHSVRMETCFPNKGNALAPICKQRDYVIDAVAGLAYKFKDQYTIEVADRFDLNKSQYNLVRTDNSVFLTPEAAKQLHDKQVAANAERYAQEQPLLAERDAQQMKEAAAAQALIAERRKNKLQQVRKIGTRICQERDGGVIYVGFVEGLADEKVQIRLSDAFYKKMPNMHPSGFTQTIIWDSPLNWDICE